MGSGGKSHFVSHLSLVFILLLSCSEEDEDEEPNGVLLLSSIRAKSARNVRRKTTLLVCPAKQ